MRTPVELRLAARNLLHHPALAVMVVATLGAALAFNIASASLLTALLVYPYPYPRLEELVIVRDATPRHGAHQGRPIATADFADLRRSVPAFSSLAAWRPTPLVITSAGAEPEQIEAAAVSANFFSTLGVSPLLGRIWPSDVDRPGQDGVVLLSRRLWNSRFGGDPSAVGREVSLNGRIAIVVAIVRDEECYPSGVDAWMPLVMTPGDLTERSAQRINAVGRLAADASIELGRAQLGSVANLLAARYPLTNAGRGFDLLPLRREQYEFTAPLFGFIQAAALLVLALAAINVTNVLVARTLDRKRELAVRAMLGASGWDIGGAVAGEALILAGVATACGAGAASAVLTAVRVSLPEGIARWVNGWSAMHIDPLALGAGAGLGLATGLLIGGVSAGTALKSIAGAAAGLRVTRRRTWGRRMLVAGEIGLAAALLLCASVMVQGFSRISAAFDTMAPARLLRFTLTLPAWRYPDDLRVGAQHTALLDALAGLPGVESAALIRNEPASNVPNPVVPFQIEQAPALSSSDMPRADVQVVSAATFDVLRADVVAGRGFATSDTAFAPHVAIVSREAVRRFWPDRTPVGATIQLGNDPRPLRVVGVVGDVRLNWYDPEASPVIYLADAQSPARTTSVLIRTRTDPESLARQVRAAVSRLDDRQPISGVEPLTTSIADSLSPLRVIERLLLAGAALSALLAAIGIYGVLSQWVGARRREFGVRFAVGASHRSIAGLVLREAITAAAAGIAAGLIVAIAGVRVAAAALLGVPSLDVPAIVIVIAGALAVTLTAALTPAMRAARVDVADLLRLE